MRLLPTLPRLRRAPAVPPSRFAALLSATTTGLLALSGAMVVTGVVLPSSQSAAASPYRHLAPATPVRLVIPSLHINAPIDPIPLESDGALVPPEDYTHVGWWDDSAEPGAARGQTVVTGHTVHTGGGAMDALPDLRKGYVDLVTRHGTMRYRVVKAIKANHAQVTAYAHQLFGQHRDYAGGARLVLVTCTDYTGTEYLSNFIVIAKALGSPVHTGHAGRHDAQRSAAGVLPAP